MIGIVWTWVIRSMLGRIVAGALVGLVALGVNNAWQRKKGADQVITGSIEKAKAANAKNEKVRERARQPGAAQRVHERFCRDCD